MNFMEEQKQRASSVDLVEFLRRQGKKLLPSGRDKRLASDHSITVSGNRWYDHSAQQGGGSIPFVQKFYGVGYAEAVTRLLGGIALAAGMDDKAKPLLQNRGNEYYMVSGDMTSQYGHCLVSSRLFPIFNQFPQQCLFVLLKFDAPHYGFNRTGQNIAYINRQLLGENLI